MNHYPSSSAVPVPAPRQGLPLPLGKPFWVYVLLVIITIVFILEILNGGSTNTLVLISMGANVPILVEQGQVWRFFTSMFLHSGLAHILFNGYALFIFGVEMERLYGNGRFIVIYIIAGLYGSWASFALGSAGVSVGASGAIFGIVGMQAAYFLRHKNILGSFSQNRLVNIAVIIGINLVFGLQPGANIDNWAHMGGLVAGFALGYFFLPIYDIVNDFPNPPQVVDKAGFWSQIWMPALAFALLVGFTIAAIGMG